MRVVGLLVMVAGCGRVGFDASTATPRDGAPADSPQQGCTFGAFQDVTLVAELRTDSREWAPSVSQDGKTMVFSRQIAGSGQDLFRVSRGSIEQPWSNLAALVAVNSAGEEDDPTLSADGTELIFGEGALFRSRLEGKGFSPPVVFFDDAMFSILEGPELTADGLTLYFNASDGRSQIFTATRPSLAAEFEGFAPLSPDPDPTGDAGWPTISTDELELFFSSEHGGQRDIWRSVRSDKTEPWGTAQHVPELSSPGEEFDPELSHDGTTIWFSSDRTNISGHDIYVATRSCL